MARVSAIQEWLNAGGSREEFLRRWNLGGDERESLISEVGYSNEGACYNAARNAGIIPRGPVKNGNKENINDGDKEQRKPRAKGVLPIEVERWIRDGRLADFLFAGGDRDDYEPVEEITPEIFFAHRPVFEETKAYAKIIARIGGLDSDAGKSLRAWAGRPLTREQEEQEAAERESAASATLLPKIAKLLWRARELASHMESSDLMEEIESLIEIHKLPDND